MKLEHAPREAIDELISLAEIAEDKNKIALVDLLRILMMHEANAAHILNKHWQSFEVSIFGYLECIDIKDAEAKVMHNYHLGSLRMLGNIYLTDSGKDFMQGEEASNSLMNFCSYSFGSVNPKVVFTSAIVLFNHVLCFKRDKSLLNAEIEKALTKISEKLSDSTFTDPEGLIGLLLCECRMLY